MSERLTRETVEKVAELARLKLDEAELETYTQQLAEVVEYVALLEEAATDDVEPMVHALEMTNVMREDEPAESLPRDEVLANAPKTDGRFFVVPQIFEGS